MMAARTARSVDVLFLLEGTYPYVRGGVSSWINRLIVGFPDVRFGIVFLGSDPADYDGHAYALAGNVVHYEEHFLYVPDTTPRPRRERPAGRIDGVRVRTLHSAFRVACDGCGRVPLESLNQNTGLTEADFYQARGAWEWILEAYEKIEEKPPFADYFWTLRGMHGPLWVIEKIVKNAPRARIFHSASTGYAGYLGALLSHRHGGRLIVSEHGIYTKERRIDLMLASWAGARKDGFAHAGASESIRFLWIRFFETLAHIAYQQAERIVNLYAGARALQIKDGAHAGKLSTVPNGIAVRSFSSARRSYELRRPVIALIGRVVRIKDIKTFIRAANILLDRDRELEAWVVGPTGEDREYSAECQALIGRLGLEGRIRLLGHRSTIDILHDIRVSVLSSISEGLPLTVLESFAAGVPVVATDVGACRELIFGGGPDDAALGPAGAVAPIANPEALAAGIQGILSEPARWRAMSEAAIARVERHYQEEQMFAAYRELYHLGAGSA